MSKWNNKQILITGAGSGIGQALARLFAKEGAKLILTDVNEANLNTTANELIHAISISQVADASKKADWQTLAANIKQEVGYLDVLINNAGMTSFGYFDETSEALFNKVMDVNFNGVVTGCREMQPLLEKSERGLIVNIASIFSLITMPMLTPYHASKFAVRGFSEALRQDMMFQKKNIDVVCVMPGGIRTNIANSAETEVKTLNDFSKHFASVARTTSEQAAKVIEKGMRKNIFRILIGADAKLVDILYKVLPTDYYKVSNVLLGVKKFLKT
ncbi:MAG: short-subunit dehydrogenase [Oleiphilaceae bacterium]|jgi:short-subunit dehydrogenase